MASRVTLVCVTGLWGCLLTSEWVRMGQRAGHGYKTSRRAPRGLLSPARPPLTSPQSPKINASSWSVSNMRLGGGHFMFKLGQRFSGAYPWRLDDLSSEMSGASRGVSGFRFGDCLYIHTDTSWVQNSSLNTRFLSVSYTPLKLFSFQRSIRFMYMYECLACVHVYIPPVCWYPQKL